MSRRVERPQVPDWRRYQDQLEEVRAAPINFDRDARESHTVENGWNVDHHEAELPPEPPGPPMPEGSWAIACDLVRSYAFPDPSLITGIFSPDEPLAGRPMLLRARFLGFRFWFGVRLTDEIDAIRQTESGPVRVWGYGYYTLEGHFERGEIQFEVRKDMNSGRVTFHVEATSQPDHISNPFYRIGFKLFGRRLQLRFARSALERVQRLTAETLAARREQQPDPGPMTRPPQPLTPEAEDALHTLTPDS